MRQPPGGPALAPQAPPAPRAGAPLTPLFFQEAAAACADLQQSLATDPPAAVPAQRAAFALLLCAALADQQPLAELCRALRTALRSTSEITRTGPTLDLLRRAAAAAAEAIAALRRDPASPPPPALSALAAGLAAAAAAPPPHTSESAGQGGPPRSGWSPLCDDDMVEPFIEEATERLEALGHKLLRLEAAPDDRALIQDLFRDLHTLKGSSGLVGLQQMNRLAHAAEDLVGQLRTGTRVADRQAIDALLAALDALREILSQALSRGPIDFDLRPVLDRLRAETSWRSDVLSSQPQSRPPPPAVPAPAPAARRPSLSFSRRAAPRGTGPSRPLSLQQPRAETQQQRRTLRVDFDKLDLLLNLVGELVLSRSRLHSGLAALHQVAGVLQATLRRSRRQSGPIPEGFGQVQRTLERTIAEMATGAGHLDHVAGELRDQVMKLRMVSMGRVFLKHHRTVRELAYRLGKQVRLEVEGADTELDKVLVEQIDEPLLHMVRNALDHGLELPALRRERGKPPEGVLRLHARHRGGQIVIEVSDDGNGIDVEAVRARAGARGLLPPEELATLPGAAVTQLIFHPGFSMAQQVSEISGRGVGLDVVQQVVLRLKGSIEIRSELGRGTCFMLRLPLTLAIIQVLVLEVGGQVFALPLDMVRRALLLRAGEIELIGDRQVLVLEAESEEVEVPLIDLREVLELPGPQGAAAAPSAERGQPVILCEVGHELYGMCCDRQHGKREIVVKSLGALLEEMPCVAGATLIDDRVVLLLDTGQVVQRALRLARGGGQREVAAGGPRQRTRILVVDDSAIEREVLARLLRAHGYEVVTAGDGRTAAALAAADPLGFDLISTDVTMPDGDGYELVQSLRAQSRHQDVPILMLTARTDAADRVRGFDAGVDEYLLKPVPDEQLLRAVSRHLLQAGRRAGTRPPGAACETRP